MARHTLLPEQILVALNQHLMTKYDLAEKFGVTPWTIGQHLSRLEAKALIKRVGSATGGRYVYAALAREMPDSTVLSLIDTMVFVIKDGEGKDQMLDMDTATGLMIDQVSPGKQIAGTIAVLKYLAHGTVQVQPGIVTPATLRNYLRNLRRLTVNLTSVIDQLLAKEILWDLDINKRFLNPDMPKGSADAAREIVEWLTKNAKED